jgi:curved DNA-binding protein CbpA
VYRYLAQKHHPDRNPTNRVEAERIMRLINDAYAVLSDPKRRRQHDIWIQTERAKGQGTNDSLSERTARTKETAPGAPSQMSFFRRGWLMLLFVASLVMILGVFPFQMIAGEWKSAYLSGVALWLAASHYAYSALFHPKVAAK